jgi:hypothetical protein
MAQGGREHVGLVGVYPLYAIAQCVGASVTGNAWTPAVKKQDQVQNKQDQVKATKPSFFGRGEGSATHLP